MDGNKLGFQIKKWIRKIFVVEKTQGGFVGERRMLADLRVGEGSMAEGKSHLLHPGKGRLGQNKALFIFFLISFYFIFSPT